jgi:hypothetical protein
VIQRAREIQAYLQAYDTISAAYEKLRISREATAERMRQKGLQPLPARDVEMPPMPNTVCN